MEGRAGQACRPERSERGIGDDGHAASRERHVAGERGQRCDGAIADEDGGNAERLELGESCDEPVHLTGAVRSAEVAEEDKEGRPAQEVAEAVCAVRPVHLGVTKIRGELLSETHGYQ